MTSCHEENSGSGEIGETNQQPQRRRRRRHQSSRRLVFTSDDDGALEVGSALSTGDIGDGSNVDDAACFESSTFGVARGAAGIGRLNVLGRAIRRTAEVCGDRLGRLFASIGSRQSSSTTPPPTEQRRIRQEEALERRHRRSARHRLKNSAFAFAYFDNAAGAVVVEAGVNNDDEVFPAAVAPLPSVSAIVAMSTVANPVNN